MAADQTRPAGDNIGRMIRELIPDTIKATKQATAGHDQEQAVKRANSIFDSLEVPLGEQVTALLEGLREITDIAPMVGDILDRADKPVNGVDFFTSLILYVVGAIPTVLEWASIFYRGLTNQVQQQYPTVPLSPADAADAVERNILTEAEGASAASLSGVGADVFGQLVKLTGEPPGVIDMLRLWRRGDLDQATLETMIAYSRIRTEWTPLVEKLAFDTLSGADVVEGIIKGQIDQATGVRLWQAAGGMADQLDLATSIAGNPIGVEQAGTLYNHGLITDDQYTSVILHSRINPQFEAMAKLLRYRYLSEFQIDNALKAGTVDPSEATKWLTQQGYPSDQVAAIVSSATSPKTVKPKVLAESLVLDTYETGMITAAQAHTLLIDLGYTDSEIPLILDSYDARKVLAVTQQAVTAIRKAYLAGRLTDPQASGDLDSLNIDPAVRDHYLKAWKIEQSTEVRQLSAAQIGDLLKAGAISEGYAVQRWTALGYDHLDATLLPYLYGATVPAKAVM